MLPAIDDYRWLSSDDFEALNGFVQIWFHGISDNVISESLMTRLENKFSCYRIEELQKITHCKITLRLSRMNELYTYFLC